MNNISNLTSFSNPVDSNNTALLSEFSSRKHIYLYENSELSTRLLVIIAIEIIQTILTIFSTVLACNALKDDITCKSLIYTFFIFITISAIISLLCLVSGSGILVNGYDFVLLTVIAQFLYIIGTCCCFYYRLKHS